MSREFRVSSDQARRRLDRIIRSMWPQVPLGAIMKALRKGEVRVDAKKADPAMKPEEGQLVQVPWSDEPRAAVSLDVKTPKREPLETIYRDESVWIVNKNAGLLTQPDSCGGDSLISRALAELGWIRSDFSPATVQRLDRNTSGAVIIAMTGEMLRLLSELVRERKIKKVYLAVVEGLIAESGEINLPLVKDSARNVVKAGKSGSPALTRYSRLGGDKKMSMVEIDLVTGRSHQARAHMAAIGHPIVGDVKYGGSSRLARRPLLHARSVEFSDDERLPDAIKGKKFTARVPKDMEGFFNAL